MVSVIWLIGGWKWSNLRNLGGKQQICQFYPYWAYGIFSSKIYTQQTLLKKHEFCWEPVSQSHIRTIAQWYFTQTRGANYFGAMKEYFLEDFLFYFSFWYINIFLSFFIIFVHIIRNPALLFFNWKYLSNQENI